MVLQNAAAEVVLILGHQQKYEELEDDIFF